MNIFQTDNGVMNIAPIRISGQYKIIVGIDNNLYLDDYTNRRVLLDKSKPFLPQVTNFLKIQNSLDNYDALRYGAYQKNNVKTYHIPVYFSGEKYPDTFVLSRVPNDTITDSTFLFKYSNLVDVKYFDKIGLTKIFEEIGTNDFFNYPILFNWEDGYVKLRGYGIEEDIEIEKQIPLVNSQANQNYFETLNNTLINNYKDNKLFYPRFLNIEFEFEFVKNYGESFNNFYGYLGNREQITQQEITNLKHNFKVAEYSNKIEWSQLVVGQTFVQNEYSEIIATGSIQEVSPKDAQVKLKCFKIQENQYIRIYDEDDDLSFEYVVTAEDVQSGDLNRISRLISKNITLQSGYFYQVQLDYSLVTNSVKITIINKQSNPEQYRISVSPNFQILDRYLSNNNAYYFRGINENDIWLCGQPSLTDNNDQIKILDEIYQIVDRFKFNDKTILRLDRSAGITGLSTIDIFEDRIEKIYTVNKLDMLNFNSSLESLESYDIDLYSQNLISLFPNSETLPAAIPVLLSKNIKATYQYVDDSKNELDDMSSIIISDYNMENIKNPIFSSVGFTTFITPNTLNFDKRFYENNGNINQYLLDNDNLKFNWFLIKGLCPDYLKNDIRSKRYFTVKPEIYSEVVKIGDACQTVFMGVQYRLPLKYEGYKFAVCLDPNNELDVKLSYDFTLDISDKSLLLTINKYLDFVDLIRGGNTSNDPLIDLSFFYNVSSALNSKSDFYENFESSAIELCYDFRYAQPAEYFTFPGHTEHIRDWKFFDTLTQKWYVALKLKTTQGAVNNLQDLFTAGEDSEVYIYSKLIYQGVERRVESIKAVLKGIIDVQEDMLWCEDVEFTFFDTEKIFIQKYNNVLNQEDIFYIEKTDITIGAPSSNTIYGDFIKTVFVNSLGQQFNLILPDKSISLKEYYFDITQTGVIEDNGAKTITQTVFRFPDFNRPDLTDQDIITEFLGTTVIDQSIIDLKITLFDRNQLWKISKDLFLSELKFKDVSEAIIKRELNTFLVTNLVDYTEVQSLPILNSDEYIKVTVEGIKTNSVIWNLLKETKLTYCNRISTAYYPFFERFSNELNFQLFQFKRFNSLYNIYDKNFIDTGINATGLWDEIYGNIVSSLFCKNNDIQIETVVANKTNILSILKNTLTIDDCVIGGNKNENYISKIDNNIDAYIIDSYAKYLYDNFYYLDSVTYDGKKIEFTIENYLLNIGNYEKLFFTFKRK